jgi:AraC family transcriptional regulator of adaptative response / DNA-3-methyladenine glycosylase II
MLPAHDICYRAIASKDARFDGRFFTGVVTTGIYCRPVCPARIPARRNVKFFPSAAAAQTAGFRPCLRCRPESSPGTPAWAGTSTTVSRALRQIADGALDDGNVGALAARLGLGERQLRRLFVEHLGASPLTVAQTRRVQLAKKLLDETALPMSHLALDAGFTSVRRFNAAVRKTYGRTPSELRRLRLNAVTPRDDSQVTLRLAYRPPLEWGRLMDYLQARAIPGVEEVRDGVYSRSVRIGGVAGVISARAHTDRPELLLRVPIELARHLIVIVERARRIFDLGADPGEIVQHLRRDPRLRSRLRGRSDIRIPGAWDGFETFVRAILGQQVSVAGATTLAGRLVAALGEPLANPVGSITHCFPESGVVMGAPVQDIGMPAARAQTIQTVAKEIHEGRLQLDAGAELDASIERLTRIPGIGPWTAHYVAMRVLGEPDAFPAGDLGVRKAFAVSGRMPSERELCKRAEAWRPWRAYVAMLMWTSRGGGR